MTTRERQVPPMEEAEGEGRAVGAGAAARGRSRYGLPLQRPHLDGPGRVRGIARGDVQREEVQTWVSAETGECRCGWDRASRGYRPCAAIKPGMSSAAIPASYSTVSMIIGAMMKAAAV